jgi:tetratricopeptide (TPR) repeat protein
MRIGLFLNLTAAALSLAGAPTDPLDDPGFQHFYNLEYQQALDAFTRKAAQAPHDPVAQNHIAQALLYWEMLRNGALESELVNGTNPFVRRPHLNVTPDSQRRFDEAIQRSIKLSEARIAQNPRDSRALYSLGVAYGLRANWNFLVKKGWIDALRDATQARKLHNQAFEYDPTFIDARLVEGAHDYVVGSLPWHYKVLSFLVGFHGDREEGMRTLRLVAEKGSLNKADAAVLLAAILRREKRPAEAIPLLQGVCTRFPRNYLFRFELSLMYADSGDETNALAQLNEIERLKSSGAPGYRDLPMEKIDYAKGNLFFWYDHYDRAIEHLKKATARPQVFDLQAGALAWMRLGQAFDLKGQRPNAKWAYQEAIKFAPQSELARESRGYLDSPYKRKRRT